MKGTNNNALGSEPATGLPMTYAVVARKGRSGGHDLGWNSLVAVTSLARLFWWDSELSVRVQACARFAAVTCALLFRGKARIWLSNMKRQQMQELLSRSASRSDIARAVLRYVAALLVLSPVNKIYLRLFRGLRLLWEKHLTKNLLDDFLGPQCIGGGWTDEALEPRHPDQRIATDVSKFTQLATGLALDGLQAAIDIYFFASLLYKMSPLLSMMALTGGLSATLLVRFLGRRLPSQYAAERSADGHFTYVLTRMRDHAEAIVFYKGQQREIQHAHDALDLRQSTEWTRFATKDVVGVAVDQYRQVLGLCPTLVLAHIAGVQVDAATLAQASEAFDSVLRGLFLFADNWTDFSRVEAVASELYTYKCEQTPPNSEDVAVSIKMSEAEDCGSWLQVESLSLWVGGRVLVSQLSFVAPSDGGFLISGPSGSGKTSVLRAIAGLWCRGGCGHIRRATRRSSMLFLPQRPYMTLGSLREQLLYPFGASTGVDDNALFSILERLGLGHVLQLAERNLDFTCRWDEQLSVGEQQRLSVARVWAQRPLYVILDEITSANDAANEGVMYQCIASSCKAFMSIGHRESLQAFHSVHLKLLGVEGKWCLDAIVGNHAYAMSDRAGW